MLARGAGGASANSRRADPARDSSCHPERSEAESRDPVERRSISVGVLDFAIAPLGMTSF
ncbi:MAG: hypothetical protein QOJ05_702, partial [Verrucomicrobiota bacterium]